LHDERGRIRRPFRGKRWIICLLEFKDRKRPIMRPGHYTELFFLDEATALAAGHRPCAECQRERFNLFRETWAKANPELVDTARPAATKLDAILHQDRTDMSSEARRYNDSIEDLPDGVFVTDDGVNAYLVLEDQPLLWSPAGYVGSPVRDISYPVQLLTPASVVRTLGAGYPVDIHTSAFQGVDGSQS